MNGKRGDDTAFYVIVAVCGSSGGVCVQDGFQQDLFISWMREANNTLLQEMILSQMMFLIL